MYKLSNGSRATDRQIKIAKKNIERLLWLSAGTIVLTVYAIYFLLGE